MTRIQLTLAARGRRYAALAALAAVAITSAACGGGGGTSATSGGGSVGARFQPVSASISAVVGVKTAPRLGAVIVDADGMTLYDSHGDDPMLYQFDRSPVPTCFEACADTWPPLLTPRPPVAIGGAEASLLGTIRRRDGYLQVTYDGHPLYRFAQDVLVGETNGNRIVSFGRSWHALEPDGEEPAG